MICGQGLWMPKGPKSACGWLGETCLNLDMPQTRMVQGRLDKLTLDGRPERQSDVLVVLDNLGGALCLGF